MTDAIPGGGGTRVLVGSALLHTHRERDDSASKAVRAQGRDYIVSSEGEDLQANFRPAWSRTPKLDVIVCQGLFEDKIRDALDARKARSLQEKVDYLGYATFQGHVLDWGVKMVVTRVISAEMLIAYQMIFARVAEEFGGVRTAYYYDLLLRLQLAKSLEDGSANVQDSLCKLDPEVLADAKQKVDVKAKVNGAALAKPQFSGSPAATSSKGGKGGGKAWGGKHANAPAQSWSTDPWSQRSRSPTHKKEKEVQKHCGDSHKNRNKWGSRKW